MGTRKRVRRVVQSFSRNRIDAKWHRSAREVSVEREKCRAARLRECEVGGVVGGEAMRLGEGYELSEIACVG